MPVENLSSDSAYSPLAARMRPRSFAEFIGQQHLLGLGKPLSKAVERQVLHSMILWGPPGIGKTTLAKLLAQSIAANVETISAVLSGVKEIREVVLRAQKILSEKSQPTVIFVDEVHRFNKIQQDAFLPFIESGLLILIGVTTENPSFELNQALLSRTRVYVLNSLTEAEILLVIDQALKDQERGLGGCGIILAEPERFRLAQLADGDARQALNLLEIIADLALDTNQHEISAELLENILTTTVRRFDKKGEQFYDQISAFHKAIRGSAVDASLYWLSRMIDGGNDPSYLIRRMIRIAVEDIGLADPRALTITLEAAQAYERLGTPEGELALAQAAIYLAVAAKSNAGYLAFNEAMSDVQQYGSLAVPLSIRNAPTGLMKQLGYGKNYRYAHDEPLAYAAGEDYLPEQLPKKNYYRPTDRGLEAKIKEKLSRLKQLDLDYLSKKSDQ